MRPRCTSSGTAEEMDIFLDRVALVSRPFCAGVSVHRQEYHSAVSLSAFVCSLVSVTIRSGCNGKQSKISERSMLNPLCSLSARCFRDHPCCGQVKRRQSLDRVVIVDDTPSTFQRNYGNGVPVRAQKLLHFTCVQVPTYDPSINPGDRVLPQLLRSARMSAEIQWGVSKVPSVAERLWIS